MLVIFRDTMLNSNNRSDTFDNYWRIIKTMNQRELFHPKNKYFHLIHLEKNTHNSSYKCSAGKHGAPNCIIWIQSLIQNMLPFLDYISQWTLNYHSSHKNRWHVSNWTTNALLTRLVMALTPIDKNFFLLQTTNAPYFHKV